MIGPILEPVTAQADLVTLAQAKAHLHEDANDQDAAIADMIAAASAALDGPNGMYGHAVSARRWRLMVSGPDADGFLTLPVEPVTTLHSIAYYPQGGGAAVVADSPLELQDWTRAGSKIWPASMRWPALADRFDAVVVEWTAGPATVEADVRRAALLMVGDMYAHRESVVTGTITSNTGQIEQLVALKRRWWTP